MSARPTSYADALRGRHGAPAAAGKGRAPGAATRPRLLLRPLLRYVPVVLGCGILWHLYVHGLEPAWSEHRRLSAAHSVIAADNQQLRSLHGELLLAQAALEDPHYQERRSRWRAERLAARARLPDETRSRPADLVELARQLAAGSDVVLAEEPAWLTESGSPAKGPDLGPTSPAGEAVLEGDGPATAAEPLVGDQLPSGSRAAPRPSGVR